MDIDIMIKNARNVHIEEMGKHIIQVLNSRINQTVKLRNKHAKENNKSVVDTCNDIINAYLDVWYIVDTYVKLEKR